jgi:hypothetical protein
VDPAKAGVHGLEAAGSDVAVAGAEARGNGVVVEARERLLSTLSTGRGKKHWVDYCFPHDHFIPDYRYERVSKKVRVGTGK